MHLHTLNDNMGELTRSFSTPSGKTEFVIRESFEKSRALKILALFLCYIYAGHPETPYGHSKNIISIRGGILHLQPLLKPSDRLFEFFVLSKALWLNKAELDLQAKSKQLEREVHFARSILGFTFVDDETAPEHKRDVANSVVVSAILRWMEDHVVKDIPSSTFQSLSSTFDEMKVNCPQQYNGIFDEQRYQHHQAHGFQITLHSTESEEIPFLEVVSKEENDDKAPVPWGSTFEPQLITSYSQGAPVYERTSDIDSINTLESMTSMQFDDPMDNTENAAIEQDVTSQQTPPVQQPQTTDMAEFPAPKQESVMSGPDDTPLAQVGCCDRPLDELLWEFHSRHSTAERKSVQTQDVVSGKGEKAKMHNTGYRELIRAVAPTYKSTNSGDPHKDLEEKRRLAYGICLEVVNRGGRFLGKNNQPLPAKDAFKRVMTSLKDWKKPSHKRWTGQRRKKVAAKAKTTVLKQRPSNQCRPPLVKKGTKPTVSKSLPKAASASLPRLRRVREIPGTATHYPAQPMCLPNTAPTDLADMLQRACEMPRNATHYPVQPMCLPNTAPIDLPDMPQRACEIPGNATQHPVLSEFYEGTIDDSIQFNPSTFFSL